MKKVLLVIGVATSLIMTGCASHKPLTESDGYYKDYTKITNYERIQLDSSDIELTVNVSESVDQSNVDVTAIRNTLKGHLLKKGINVTITNSAKYTVTVNAIQKTDLKNMSNFNPVPSSLANATQQVTGSSSAGAAALGAGMVLNAFTDKRMWLVDCSIYIGNQEHTRYTRLAPAAAEKQGLNGICALATSEFFELKK